MLTPMSGEQLRAARNAAAELYQQIAARLTPEGIKVEYRNSLSGRAWPKERRLVAPRPTTRRRLQIYLHEVAHIVLNHVNKKPRHVEEMEAEKWSFEAMRSYGVAVPQKSLQRAKRYVAYKIRQAKRRGAKHIDPRAAKFSQ